jgi:hypothetical protein
MQYGKEADFSPQMFGIGSDSGQGLGHGSKQILTAKERGKASKWRTQTTLLDACALELNPNSCGDPKGFGGYRKELNQSRDSRLILVWARRQDFRAQVRCRRRHAPPSPRPAVTLT